MKKIKLTQNKYALVDKDMFKLLSIFKWCAMESRNTFYAANGIRLPNGRKTTVLMHHLIIGHPPKGLMCDHINRNGLDNRRSNLRFATNRENQLNTLKGGFRLT